MNNTGRKPDSAHSNGMPGGLKSGIEKLSGHSMDDVKVHYNSSQPAKLHAQAYAQGTQIHLSGGQQNHIPHELPHVVQQNQGRIQPTTSVAGMKVNDSPRLEREADTMSKRAAHGAVKKAF